MAFWRAELIKVLARLKELEASLPGTYQPIDPDLTAIAALSTTAYGRAFLTFADEAAFKSAVNLEAGVDYQAYDADLASWAGVTRASGFDTFVATPSSANLRALLSDEAGAGVAYFVGGDLGTPSAGVATNLTGLPISTGVSGLGTGVATFLATPSSANLAAALTNESGSGVVPFQDTGTFTPGIAFAGASVGMTYSAQTGTYTKIGRAVFCNIRVNLSAKGSSTGAATITGLPFTPASIGSAPISYYSAMSGLSGPPGVLVDSFANGLRIYNPGAASAAAITDAFFTDTTDIRLSLWFTV